MKIEKLFYKLIIFIKYGIFIPHLKIYYYKNKTADYFSNKTELEKQKILNKITLKFNKKYRKRIAFYKAEIDKMQLEQKKERIIWFCWLQGIENAPPLVKINFKALTQSLGKDYKINLITSENINNYITLPEFIIKKFKKGIISPAHFSDIVRNALLIEYGGTWIDSTIYCEKVDDNIKRELLDCNLFVFQNLFPFPVVTSTENWFITSCKNNRNIILLQNLLLEYWKHNNIGVDYLFYYCFLEIIKNEYQYDWKKMPIACNMDALLLQKYLFEEFDVNIYNQIMNSCCFQKLTHHMDKSILNKENTFYKYLLAKSV